MAAFYHVFAIYVLYTALGLTTLVTALNKGNISTTISPSSTPSSMATLHQNTSVITSKHMTVTSSLTMTSTLSPNATVLHSRTTTVMPSHYTTVTPSHNMTVMPSRNMTVTPSHNMTITPSHNMTMTPSHNMTIMPHNSTVMPSQNRTIMPSSAHTVMPTSSVHPLMPKRGNFSVKDSSGTACLVADMAATFDIMINSKKSKILLPVNASVSGKCANSSIEPFINLRWHTMHSEANFTMYFVKYKMEGEDLKASVLYWAAANLTFSLKTGVGATASVHTFQSGTELLTQLSAELGHAFKCKTSTLFNLTAINSTVDLSLTDIEFQAFGMRNGQISKKVDKCGAPVIIPTTPTTTQKPTATSTQKPKESHVVAIAVGCSLAGLVLIVLIGYLIGRRRSRNASQGYRQL